MPDSRTQPDSRMPAKAYMIANLGNVVPETNLTKHAQELYDFVEYVATRSLKNDGGAGELFVQDEAKHLIAKIGQVK